MTLFESIIALLAVAAILLQVSRRLQIPYPTVLAAGGVLLALVPGAPTIALDPHMALALFIAPVLVDAAFDFPLAAVRRYWRPLFALAVVAVLLTAGAVAALGVMLAALPLHAAVALGAIVAPPDAAAATAVLRNVTMPRRSVLMLKGESLLNDAIALILFTAALAVHDGQTSGGELGLRLALAAPGGVLLGIALAWLLRKLMPFVTGTLGGNLVEFISAIGAWLIAERLHLSAVLCVVAFAMSIAGYANRATAPRVRIHSFAVWETAVFLLNVLAFLLMGLQARSIIGEMSPDRFEVAASFAGAVVLTVILVRMLWLIVYNRLAFVLPALRGDLDPAPLRHGILIGWSGMRGLVTLATAFALPADFPQRDLIVLSAFAVVLATLVFQGLTLGPVVRLLKLDGDDGVEAELNRARERLAGIALEALKDERSSVAERMRSDFELKQRLARGQDRQVLKLKRRLGLEAIRRQRRCLEELRGSGQLGADAFLILQEELDFAEVPLADEDERHLEEN